MRLLNRTKEFLSLVLLFLCFGIYGVSLDASARAAYGLFNQLSGVFGGERDIAIVRAADYPEIPRAGYEAVGDELGRLGFDYLGSLEDQTVTRVMPASKTYLDVYVNRADRVIVATYYLSDTEPDAQVVDFAVSVGDGAFLTSTSSRSSAWLSSPPRLSREIVAGETLEEMNRRMRERLLEEMEGGGRGARPLESLNDILEVYREFSRTESEYRQSLGFLTYDEFRSASRRGGGFYLPGTRLFFYWMFRRRVAEFEARNKSAQAWSTQAFVKIEEIPNSFTHHVNL